MNRDLGRRSLGSHKLTLLVLLFATLCSRCLSQEAPAEKQAAQSTQGGMSGGASTSGAHAPVKDALSRPITAGGFVDGAPVVFVDVANQAGLDKFHHQSGSYEKNTILETPGSG